MTRTALALLAFLLAAVSAAQAPAAPPAPTAAPPAAARPTPAKPPLDFTGVWELDEKASRNVSPAMKGEVLNVRQTGNQIWISSMNAEHSRLLSESIVVDGRPYEKTLGTRGKGYLTASWGTDNKSLWLEVTAGPESDPRSIVQRSIWKLTKDRRTWVRQSVSMQEGKSSETMLVLRRRESSRTGTGSKPAPTRTPAPRN